MTTSEYLKIITAEQLATKTPLELIAEAYEAGQESKRDFFLEEQMRNNFGAVCKERDEWKNKFWYEQNVVALEAQNLKAKLAVAVNALEKCEMYPGFVSMTVTKALEEIGEK